MYVYIFTLLILHFKTTVIGKKSYEIAIRMNKRHMYNSYGLPIIKDPPIKSGGSVNTDA